MGISAWFLIKKRETILAKRSILIAAIFGLASSLFLAFTGDSSAKTIAKYQPVKFAAFEALSDGKTNAPLVAFGVLKGSGEYIGKKELPDFLFKIEIPNLLSVMTSGDKDSYVPGLKDHVTGNPDLGIMSVAEKSERGKIARQTLLDYKTAKENKDNEQVSLLLKKFQDKDFRDNYFRYFGYAYINTPEEVIPDIYGAFYSFHLMVMLGFLFIFIFSVAIILLFTGRIESQKWFLRIAVFSIPLPLLASELGWILTEMGRQPWIIQDLMPTSMGVSNISTGSVQVTFWLFAFLFTALLIAEISIMLKQIKSGPKH